MTPSIYTSIGKTIIFKAISDKYISSPPYILVLTSFYLKKASVQYEFYREYRNRFCQYIPA